MTASKDFTKTLEFDPDKVEAIYEKLVETFKEAKLTIGEIIIAYSNLGYTLGASIEGYSGSTGPSIDELKQKYYTQPTIGVALCLQSLEVASWFETWNNQKIEEDNKKEKV